METVSQGRPLRSHRQAKKRGFAATASTSTKRPAAGVQGTLRNRGTLATPDTSPRGRQDARAGLPWDLLSSNQRTDRDSPHVLPGENRGSANQENLGLESACSNPGVLPVHTASWGAGAMLCVSSLFNTLPTAALWVSTPLTDQKLRV